MQFLAEVEQVRTLKKGMKIIFSIDDEHTKLVLKNIHNFMDMPIIVDLNIDADTQKERLGQISEEQRKKIYALIKDIAAYAGDSNESTKDTMKSIFCGEKEIENFSLSNCTRETASDFIEFLINFAFENGVALKESPRDYLDDIERYILVCIKNKVCAVCGKPAETHHWDAIGRGRDRRKYDDSDHRKITLCREHHTEVETIGRDTFAKKHHVIGVIVP